MSKKFVREIGGGNIEPVSIGNIEPVSIGTNVKPASITIKSLVNVLSVNKGLSVMIHWHKFKIKRK